MNIQIEKKVSQWLKRSAPKAGTQSTYEILYAKVHKILELQEIRQKNDKNFPKSIREQRAWHGSGADFEAFDSTHMGEGEGMQSRTKAFKAWFGD